MQRQMWIKCVKTLQHAVWQVCLLMQMDCTMLPQAKSPLPHCTPSQITKQQALPAILKADCYT